MIHKKFYLSIGAIFKNESHILDEWINHHYQHGVEHFFLINDKSTDNYYEILKKYIDNGLVTLFNLNTPMQSARQEAAYNYYFSLTKVFTEWLAIIDLDEFIYSTLSIDIKNVLKVYNTYDQVLIKAKIFGSSGFIEQPAEVIPNFIDRRKLKHYDAMLGEERDILDNRKYISRTDKVYSYGVHNSTVVGKSVLVDYDILVYNHYKIQSFNFYSQVKIARGDAFYNNNPRSLDVFKDEDYDDERDEFLKNQNENIPLIKLHPKEIEHTELLTHLNNFYNSQDYDSAISLGLKVISKDSSNINAIFIIGNSLLAKKQYTLAIYFYNLIIKLDPSLNGPVTNRDYCLYILRADAEKFFIDNPNSDNSKFLYLL